MSTKLQTWFARALFLLHGIGPYAVLGLVLPGGSVIALVIWLYRHRSDLAALRLGSWCKERAQRIAAAFAPAFARQVARQVARLPGLAPAQLPSIAHSTAPLLAAAPRTSNCHGTQTRSF